MAQKNAQKRVDSLIAERAGLAATIATLETDRATLQDTLPRLQADAERGGNTAERDAAEQQVDTLAKAIERKRAALVAVTDDLTAARLDAADQQRDSWLVEAQTVRREAGTVADALDHDLFNPALWARLWALYDRFTWLRQQIDATGDTSGMKFLKPWHSPARLLAAQFNALRIVAAQHPDPGEFQKVLTARAALGLDTEHDQPATAGVKA